MLVADLEVPAGSTTVHENAYGIPGLENIALVTVTPIVTPEDADSKILFGVNAIVYDSPTALAGLTSPNVMIATRRIRHRTGHGVRSCN